VTTIALSAAPAPTVRTDALVVGIAPGRRNPVLVGDAADLAAAFDGKLPKLLADLGATGRADEVVRVATMGATKAPVLLAVGLGERPRGGYEVETLRRAAGSAARALAGTGSAAVLAFVDEPDGVVPVAEGALLGAYAFTRFRSSDDDAKTPLSAVTVLTSLTKDTDTVRGVKASKTVADAVHLARDLVNTPPSHLHPRELADAAVAAAKGVAGLTVEVLDEKALKKQGYGGIIAVGQGSVNPPRLVRMTWQPARAKTHLALVGKGITFDSGGLSLKPPQSMESMKSDMGGAAAVIAATTAIARLKLPVAVTAYAAIAENMPSGTAQRPSDVYTSYAGKTVEVLNTDAEGRLVLADALARACEDEPDVLIDAATLTGAQLVALGSRTSGVMGNDDELRDAVADAANHAGDASWPMPIAEELRGSLDSDVADIKNIGERFGGMMTAAAFLQDFVADGTKWVHLDIAGPAFNESKPYGYTPKGGTGAAVRTFVEVALRMSRKQL
jgi:leucyl aminopeptidase